MVSLESFDTICIEVKERQEGEYVLTTSGIGVITDAHGYVLRTVQNANESHPELVRVQGLSVKKTIIGQKLIANQQKQLDAVTEVLLQLTSHGRLTDCRIRCQLAGQNTDADDGRHQMYVQMRVRVERGIH